MESKKLIFLVILYLKIIKNHLNKIKKNKLIRYNQELKLILLMYVN